MSNDSIGSSRRFDDASLRERIFGPLPPPPRRIRMRRAVIILWISIVTVLLAFPVGGAVAFAYTKGRLERLRDEGRVVPGTVVGVEPALSSKRSGYNVKFRFTPNENGATERSGSYFSEGKTFGKKSIGDTLRITYLPTDPAVFETDKITNEYISQKTTPTLGGTMIVGVMDAILLVVATIHQRRRIRRITDGKFSLVEILRIEPRQRGTNLTLMIPTETGGLRERTIHIIAKECAHLSVGDRIGWIEDPSGRGGELLFMAAAAYDWKDVG